MQQERPIGVFDSGVGGLTVLKALLHFLPEETYLYLGDTARLPYGTKAPETVIEYSLAACNELVRRGVKMLVIACNTVSSCALPALRIAFPNIPIVGVVEATAEMASMQSTTGRILVLGTEATIRSGLFSVLIQNLRPDAMVLGQSASLLVALAEEGWTEGEVAEAALRRYLSPYFGIKDADPDCIVLGCTHFPLLRSSFERVIGPEVKIIDSARPTALLVRSLLEQADMCAQEKTCYAQQRSQFFVTDLPERFQRVASYFLHNDFCPTRVSLISF